MKLKDLKQLLIFDLFRKAIVVSQNQSIPLEDYICLEDLIDTKYSDYEIEDIYLTTDNDILVEIKDE